MKKNVVYVWWPLTGMWSRLELVHANVLTSPSRLNPGEFIVLSGSLYWREEGSPLYSSSMYHIEWAEE
jgi:hypothetical protein